VTVVFSPQRCAEVRISVDGGEPRPFGSGFASIQLEPGPHRFEFIGRGACGNDTTEIVVPRTDRFVVSRNIPFKNARLYVRTNVPARVSVNGGRVTGPTFEILEVPVSAEESSATITVTAAGYNTYTGTVRLTAAETQEPTVELEASGSSP
jgi:hypothetical protein